MNSSPIEGIRPRPRVAVVGSIEEEIVKYYNKIFPTVWTANNFEFLEQNVDYRELDLIIIGEGIDGIISEIPQKRFVDNSYVICFSEDIELPGPEDKSIVANYSTVTTESYELPPARLDLDQLRKKEVQSIESFRGIRQIHYFESITARSHNRPGSGQYKTKASSDKLASHALVLSGVDKLPIALQFIRTPSNLGVAILPRQFDKKAWVESLVSFWAQEDPKRFPNFCNWQDDPEWMTFSEIELKDKIFKLRTKKEHEIRKIDNQISSLSSELSKVSIEVNKGRRALITSQGDRLVQEVESVLQEFGFIVDNIDTMISENSPKREDLRIRLPEKKQGEWEAIIEVRGYSKSAGKTSDLQRLIGRFTNFYFNEKSRFPDKKIYIVNGQIDITNPSNREKPFSSSDEDVTTFAEEQGLIISALDLFKASKLDKKNSAENIRKSIIESTGRWKPPNN